MNGAIGIWSLPNLTRPQLIEQGRPFTAATFSPDGRLIAVAGEDGLARLLDARTGAVVHVLRGPPRERDRCRLQ